MGQVLSRPKEWSQASILSKGGLYYCVALALDH